MASHKPSHTRRLKSAVPSGREDASAPASDELQHESTAEIAEYIASMSGELAKLAKAAQLSTVTYFLELARAEAQSHIAKVHSAPN